MSKWIMAAQTSEIAPGLMKSLTLDEEPVVVCNVDGSFYAFQDMCSHQELPLDGGELCGKTLTCPWHGAKFDVATGAAVAMPAVAPIVTYPVKVEGGQIFVELP
jgi:3-phenylpropionate/trans-cinnamate dioxygenase ferredoxin subunit